MSNISNYSFLFQSMFGGTKKTWGTGATLPGVFQFSQLNSSSVQSQLKAAGIDTGSKQYKAVIRQMTKDGCTGNMFTNVQAIKNLMKQYNSNGDWVDPTTGLTGLLVTDEMGDSYKKIIDIPESSKDEMFEQTKKEFCRKTEFIMAIRRSGQMYIPICTGRYQKMTGCQRDIRWSSMSGRTVTHSMLQ